MSLCGNTKNPFYGLSKEYRINILVLEITCAILAVISVRLYGNGSRYAPLLDYSVKCLDNLDNTRKSLPNVDIVHFYGRHTHETTL